MSRGGPVLTRASWPQLAYWVAVVLVLVLGAAPLLPPAVDGDPAPHDFDDRAAREHIGVIAREPHPMGSPEIVEVRDYLAQELRDLGLEPQFQELTAVDYYRSSGAAVPVVNVIARIEGTESTGTLALVAHFDTVPETPGANDNASGVAVLLESARALLAGAPPRNDVLLVFTDGEEPAPKFGAAAFVSDQAASEGIRFVVNLEAIGTSGPSLLAEVTGPREWLIDQYAEAAPHPAAFSFLTEFTELLGGSNTDFAPFRDAGIPGVEFVYVHGSSIYHTDRDTPDRVSPRSLQAHGGNTLALSRRLAAVDLSIEREDSRMVFFTVGRRSVVRYPASWAIPSALLAGAVLILAGRRSGQARSPLRDVPTALAVAAGFAVGGTALWVPIAKWRDQLGIAEGYAWLLGLGAISVLVLIGVPRARHRLDGWTQPVAIVAAWWTLGLLAAFAMPGASYVFVLPALVGAVAISIGRPDATPRPALGAALATIGCAAIVMVPAIDTFVQFAQPRPGNPDSSVPSAIALPLLLLAMWVQLAVAFRPGPSTSINPTAAPPTLPAGLDDCPRDL